MIKQKKEIYYEHNSKPESNSDRKNWLWVRRLFCEPRVPDDDDLSNKILYRYIRSGRSDSGYSHVSGAYSRCFC